MKKSAIEMSTVIYVIIGAIALLLILLLYLGLKGTSDSIFSNYDNLIK